MQAKPDGQPPVSPSEPRSEQAKNDPRKAAGSLNPRQNAPFYEAVVKNVRKGKRPSGRR